MSIDPYSSLREIDINYLNSEIAEITTLISADDTDKSKIAELSTQLSTLTTLSSAIVSLSIKDITKGNSSTIDDKVISLAKEYLQTQSSPKIVLERMPLKDLRNIMIDYLSITDLLLISDAMDKTKVKTKINKMGNDGVYEFIQFLERQAEENKPDITKDLIKVFKEFADESQIEEFYTTMQARLSQNGSNLTSALLEAMPPEEKKAFSWFVESAGIHLDHLAGY